MTTKTFRRDAAADYKTVKGVLDDFKVPFFATGGTCLGAVREKNFIKHDDDIDLGTIAPASLGSKWLITEALRKLGFNACYEGTSKNGRHVVHRRIFTCLHWLSDEEDSYTFYWPDKTLGMRIFKKYFNGFKIVRLGSSEIRVFKQPEAYLEVKYGDDWQTPIKDKHSPAIMPE